MRFFYRLLSGATLLLLTTACPGPNDPVAANRELDQFLQHPAPGEPFETFIAAWEDHASVKDLPAEIDRRRDGDSKPELAPRADAALLLTKALHAVHEGDDESARRHFFSLSTAAGFAPLLSMLNEKHSPRLIPDLVDAIASAHLHRAVTANPALVVEDDFLRSQKELSAVLEAVGNSPGCLWALHEALKDCNWATDGDANRLLDDMTQYRIGDRAEQVFEFLMHSPLVADPADFDPVALPDQREATLLEILLQRFAERGPAPGKQLAKLLRQHAGETFGAQLIALQFELPGNASKATAQHFQKHLAALGSLPEARSAGIASLALRLTGGLSGADADTTGPLAAYHQWLDDHGMAVTGLNPAQIWLKANSIDDLPVDSHQISQHVFGMLDTLVVRDPDLASRLIIHVDQLQRESRSAEEAAIRSGSVATTVLFRTLRERPTPASRALFYNTFEKAAGKIDWTCGHEASYQVRAHLIGALYQRKPLEPRYVDFYRYFREFIDLLEIDDLRLLIVPLRHVADGLPLNDITIDGFLERLDQEAADYRKNDGESGGERFSTALEYLRLAVLLRKRVRDKRPFQPTDPEEAPWLAAIRDSGRDWIWRFVIAAGLCGETTDSMSDEFIKQSADLYVEGRHDQSPIHLAGEKDIVASAQRVISRRGDDLAELRRKLVNTWRSHISDGKRQYIYSQTRIQMFRLALEDRDQDFARRLTRRVKHDYERTNMLIAAIGGNAPQLAAEIMAEHNGVIHSPPHYQRRDEAFEANVEKFYEILKAMPAYQAGLEKYDREAYILQARALFHVAEGRPKNSATKAEAADIARQLTSIYAASEDPPPPVRRALLLMANDSQMHAQLAAPIAAWSETYDLKSLLRDSSPTAEAEIAALLLHARGRLSKTNGRDASGTIRLLKDARQVAKSKLDLHQRNEFFNQLNGIVISSFRAAASNGEEISEQQYEQWIQVLRSLTEMPKTLWDSGKRGAEFNNLILATALSGRCEELHPWWKKLPPDHQKFLTAEASDGLGSLFNTSGKFAAKAKPLQADPELRKQFAIEILKAPVPAAGIDFAGTWIYRKLATADELLEWAPQLIAGAERRGCTAYTLAKVARDRKQDLEKALTLFEQALASEKKYHSDEARFRIEHAKNLHLLGRTDEAVAKLQGYKKSDRYLDRFSGEIDKLLAGWDGAVDGNE